MSKHTPGPWCVKAHTAMSPDHITPSCDFTICGPSGASIAFEGEWNPNAAADARLIAAAPDLLAALLAVLHWIDDNCETTGFEAVEAMADAALAKAGAELFNA